LIQPFDIKSFPVSKQLYSVALHIPFWKAGSNQMGYPFGWSSLPIYYNPKHVKTKPDSYHALLDKKYKKKIVLENQPTDVMAMGGQATGAKKPYNMTTAEISRAKQYLKALKPNVLKLVSQNTEVIRALTDESAWLTVENIGTDARVRDAKGPLIKLAIPKEGMRGWMDAEMMLKGSKHQDKFEKFINAMEQAPWIAKNFLANGRPLFNEKAYKILVNTGHKERADKFFYNKPETPLAMVLKGPSSNEQAYIDAFNEVFSS
jgi:spermidine/putrescine-binding protein